MRDRHILAVSFCITFEVRAESVRCSRTLVMIVNDFLFNRNYLKNKYESGNAYYLTAKLVEADADEYPVFEAVDVTL